jgi:hypothetical protein
MKASFALLGMLLGTSLTGPFPGPGEPEPDPSPGFDTITEQDVLADLIALASPSLEGRDSPSAGLERAAEHIIERLRAAGFHGAGEDDAFRLPFGRILPAPLGTACSLELSGDGADDAGEPRVFSLGEDFVPVWQSSGSATGPLVLLGFGIDSDKFRYDDITGKLSGCIALFLEGEPQHKRKFDGPEVTKAADLYAKLESLAEAGLAGALVVRRPDEPTPLKTKRGSPEPPEAPGTGPLRFRHTWAVWNGEREQIPRAVNMPVLEVTPEVAQTLTGLDVLELGRALDATAKPPKPVHTGRSVSLSSDWSKQNVAIDNVVAILPGSDPELVHEYVVLGAHYDHVGVDSRGRIGAGADDNASGVAALLEVAQALGENPPRRSILACAFAAEEDGLLGSQALCKTPPVPRSQMVAMINLDMVGRGSAKEVVVLGVSHNPELEDVLDDARKLISTGVKKVITGRGQELFQRSDHYSFHQIGVPALFFFEGLPISKNADYHTWRDTLDLVDLDKVANTSRMVFNTAWLLASDDERPPAPRR